MSFDQTDESPVLSDIVRRTLEEVLKKQLNSNEIQIQIEQGTKKGDNYVGIIYRVTGKVKPKKIVHSTSGQVRLIVKIAPQNAVQREQFHLRNCFIREIKMYSEVLSMFRQFQEARGIIPEESGFHEIPICYKSIDSDLEETLILEDLRVSGYEMFDRLAEPTIDRVLLVMRTLGKFHALSFAIRDQNSDQLAQYSDLPEIFIGKSDPSTQKFLDMLLENAYDALRDPTDERLLQKLKNLLGTNFNEVMLKSVSSSDAEPYAVICHGDCWSNNILFRHDDNGRPIETKLLDFQVSRYASPITDVVNYLFCCTTKNLRDKHYDEIIRTYHNSLSEMIKRLGSDPEKLFPYDVMLEQLKKFGKFGLASAIIGLNFITSKSEDSIDMEELAAKFNDNDKPQMTVKSDIFYDRMRGVIIDMDRLGYF